MGESVVDAADGGDKMGEMAPSNPVLQVSVSFGRFENDSLSWERWSSFSPNKYMEEAEKCATPGSVAQKKAYFEEHYKKIAARKAELFSQERRMETEPLKSEEPTQVDLTLNADEPDSGCGISNGEHTGEEDLQATNLVSVLDKTNVNELSEETAVAEDCQSSLLEGVKEDVEEGFKILQVREPKETDVEQPLTDKKKKVPSVESQGSKDSPMDTKREMKSKTQLKVRKAKPDHHAKSSKFAPVAKESNASAVRRKSFSSAAKVPEFSTLRASKPTPTPSIKSASQATTKTGSNLTAEVKNLSVAQSRKVPPKSLHVSLNLASSSPESAPIRKSSIMEKMGDKEIVKRAFKTFQNNYGLQKSSGNDRPAPPKQVPTKGIETRLSSMATPRKENGGSLRMSGGDSGEKKNAKAAPSSLGIKSDEKTAERRKELPKKSGEQDNHKKSEKTRMSAKLKKGKNVEIRKIRQNLNYKATPLSGANKTGI